MSPRKKDGRPFDLLLNDRLARKAASIQRPAYGMDISILTSTIISRLESIFNDVNISF